MALDKYQTLMTVVDTGSLTQAASQLGCTQSAVSHCLDALEKELGFSVLTRSRAGVRLTNEGERLLPAVRGFLGAGEQLRQTASSIRGLESGTVRIGAYQDAPANAPEMAEREGIDGLFIGRSAWDPDRFNGIIRDVLPVFERRADR